MSNRSFVRYQHFASLRALPSRRLEMYLAQVAHWIAKTADPPYALDFEDFLFDLDRDAEEGGDAEEFFEFSPRNARIEE